MTLPTTLEDAIALLDPEGRMASAPIYGNGDGRDDEFRWAFFECLKCPPCTGNFEMRVTPAEIEIGAQVWTSWRCPRGHELDAATFRAQVPCTRSGYQEERGVDQHHLLDMMLECATRTQAWDGPMELYVSPWCASTWPGANAPAFVGAWFRVSQGADETRWLHMTALLGKGGNYDEGAERRHAVAVWHAELMKKYGLKQGALTCYGLP